MPTHRCTTQAPIQSCPDWFLLPSKLIQLISEKIVFMEQYGNMRLVCKEWSELCPPHPRHLIGQVPWLWLPQDPATSTLSFYDFSQSKIHKFDPTIVIERDTPCSRGWFFIEEDMEILLYNPITGELKRNCLPSLATTPTIVDFARNESIRDPSHYDLHDGYYFYNKIKLSHIRAVILTSNPSDEDCIVVVRFQHSEWDLGFCRVGDDRWTLLKTKDGSHIINDMKYKNGLLYTTGNGLFYTTIIVYDLRVLSRKILIGNGVYNKLYLVIGNGEFDGVPLLVRCVVGDVIQVYRYSNRKARSTWRRVKNIGNSVLLITDEECEMVPINNIELNDWEGNQICCCKRELRMNGGVNISMRSINNRYIKEVPTSFGVYPLGYRFTTSLFTPSS